MHLSISKLLRQGDCDDGHGAPGMLRAGEPGAGRGVRRGRRRQGRGVPGARGRALCRLLPDVLAAAHRCVSNSTFSTQFLYKAKECVFAAELSVACFKCICSNPLVHSMPVPHCLPCAGGLLTLDLLEHAMYSTCVTAAES